MLCQNENHLIKSLLKVMSPMMKYRGIDIYADGEGYMVARKHYNSFDEAKECIDKGWDSLMMSIERGRERA